MKGHHLMAQSKQTVSILPQLPNIRRLRPLYFCDSRTSDDCRRYTSATFEHQTTMAAILPQLSNIRRRRPLCFPTLEHQTTTAAILLQLPNIRRLRPLCFRNSQTSDDYGCYTSATPHMSHALTPPATSNADR